MKNRATKRLLSWLMSAVMVVSEFGGMPLAVNANEDTEVEEVVPDEEETVVEEKTDSLVDNWDAGLYFDDPYLKWTNEAKTVTAEDRIDTNQGLWTPIVGYGAQFTSLAETPADTFYGEGLYRWEGMTDGIKDEGNVYVNVPVYAALSKILDEDLNIGGEYTADLYAVEGEAIPMPEIPNVIEDDAKHSDAYVDGKADTIELANEVKVDLVDADAVAPEAGIVRMNGSGDNTVCMRIKRNLKKFVVGYIVRLGGTLLDEHGEPIPQNTYPYFNVIDALSIDVSDDTYYYVNWFGAFNGPVKDGNEFKYNICEVYADGTFSEWHDEDYNGLTELVPEDMDVTVTEITEDMEEMNEDYHFGDYLISLPDNAINALKGKAAELLGEAEPDARDWLSFDYLTIDQDNKVNNHPYLGGSTTVLKVETEEGGYDYEVLADFDDGYYMSPGYIQETLTALYVRNLANDDTTSFPQAGTYDIYFQQYLDEWHAYRSQKIFDVTVDPITKDPMFGDNLGAYYIKNAKYELNEDDIWVYENNSWRGSPELIKEADPENEGEFKYYAPYYEFNMDYDTPEDYSFQFSVVNTYYDGDGTNCFRCGDFINWDNEYYDYILGFDSALISAVYADEDNNLFMSEPVQAVPVSLTAHDFEMALDANANLSWSVEDARLEGYTDYVVELTGENYEDTFWTQSDTTWKGDKTDRLNIAANLVYDALCEKYWRERNGKSYTPLAAGNYTVDMRTERVFRDEENNYYRLVNSGNKPVFSFVGADVIKQESKAPLARVEADTAYSDGDYVLSLEETDDAAVAYITERTIKYESEDGEEETDVCYDTLFFSEDGISRVDGWYDTLEQVRILAVYADGSTSPWSAAITEFPQYKGIAFDANLTLKDGMLSWDPLPIFDDYGEDKITNPEIDVEWPDNEPPIKGEELQGTFSFYLKAVNGGEEWIDIGSGRNVTRRNIGTEDAPEYKYYTDKNLSDLFFDMICRITEDPLNGQVAALESGNYYLRIVYDNWEDKRYYSRNNVIITYEKKVYDDVYVDSIGTSVYKKEPGNDGDHDYIFTAPVDSTVDYIIIRIPRQGDDNNDYYSMPVENGYAETNVWIDNIDTVAIDTCTVYKNGKISGFAGVYAGDINSEYPGRGYYANYPNKPDANGYLIIDAIPGSSELRYRDDERDGQPVQIVEEGGYNVILNYDGAIVDNWDFGADAYRETTDGVTRDVVKIDMHEIILRMMDQGFNAGTYSLYVSYDGRPGRFYSADEYSFTFADREDAENYVQPDAYSWPLEGVHTEWIEEGDENNSWGRWEMEPDEEDPNSHAISIDFRSDDEAVIGYVINLKNDRNFTIAKRNERDSDKAKSNSIYIKAQNGSAHLWEAVDEYEGAVVRAVYADGTYAKPIDVRERSWLDDYTVYNAQVSLNNHGEFRISGFPNLTGYSTEDGAVAYAYIVVDGRDEDELRPYFGSAVRRDEQGYYYIDSRNIPFEFARYGGFSGGEHTLRFIIYGQDGNPGYITSGSCVFDYDPAEENSNDGVSATLYRREDGHYDCEIKGEPVVGYIVRVTTCNENDEEVRRNVQFYAGSITDDKYSAGFWLEEGEAYVSKAEVCAISAKGSVKNWKEVEYAISSIDSIKSYPNKTYYILDSIFDFKGMQVNVTYENGTTAVLDVTALPEYIGTIEPVNFDSSSSNPGLLISFKWVKPDGDVRVLEAVEELADYYVEIDNVSLTGVEIKTPPTKLEYYEKCNEEIDLTGGEIELTLSNTETEVVDMSSSRVRIELPENWNYAPGTVAVRVIVDENPDITGVFQITIVEDPVSSIEIYDTPDRNDFYQYEPIDPTGLRIRMKYQSGKTEIWDYDGEEIYMTPNQGEETWFEDTGDGVVEINYFDSSVNWTVNIIERLETDISIEEAKTVYVEGEPFDATNGTITVSYNFGDPGIVPLNAATIEDISQLKAGKYDIKFTYHGMNTTLRITINEPAVDEIEIAKLPDKITYIVGQTLDVTGGKIKITYDGGKTVYKDITADMVSDFDSSAAGNKELTVTYEGKTAVYNITVEAKAVQSISLNSVPNKRIYVEGQALNADGGKLAVTYNDGSKEIVDLTLDMLSGYDKDSLGVQYIAVSYEGKGTSYTVEVVAKAITAIKVSQNPAKLSYIINEDLTVAGGKLEVSFNDMTTTEVDMTANGVTVSGYDKANAGVQTITVTYEEKTTTFVVTVLAKEVASIEISAAPTKLVYDYNTDLDITGGKIKVVFNNGESETINMTADMLSGYDKTKAGKQTITVTYAGKTATFDVTVNAKPEEQPVTPDTPDTPVTPDTPDDDYYEFDPTVQEEPVVGEGMKVFFDDASLVLGEDNQYHITYTGSAIKPLVRVTDNRVILTEGVDYTVKYTDNKNAGQATVTVKGKGTYSANETLTFVIDKRSITEAEIGGLVTKNPDKVSPVVVYGGKVLKKDKDYSFKLEDGAVEFEGLGNFEGTTTEAIEVVTSKELKSLSIKVKFSEDMPDEFIYDGTAQTIDEYLIVTDGTKEETGEYSVSYTDNVNAGKVTVMIVGTGSHKGKVKKSFRIKPNKAATFDVSYAAEAEYNKAGAKPFIVVSANETFELLTQGRDYTVKYKDNNKGGATASFKLNFKGNYKGASYTGLCTFLVKKPALDKSAENVSGNYALVGDMVYGKKGKYKPKAYIVIDGNLVVAKEYSLEYSENGKLEGPKDSLIVTASTKDKNYAGKVSISYNVVDGTGKTDVNKAKVVLTDSGKSKVYGGAGDKVTLTPGTDFTVKIGKTEITSAADITANFDIFYADNDAVGKGTVILRGKNNYVGVFAGTFKIKSAIIKKK